jgi:hypothetical protein
LKYLFEYGVVSGVSDTEWDEMLDSSSWPTKDGCPIKIFISPEDRLFLQYKDFLGEQLKTFKANATLHYYSPHSYKNHMEEVPMVGLLLQSKAEKCRSS